MKHLRSSEREKLVRQSTFMGLMVGRLLFSDDRCFDNCFGNALRLMGAEMSHRDHSNEEKLRDQIEFSPFRLKRTDVLRHQNITTPELSRKWMNKWEQKERERERSKPAIRCKPTGVDMHWTIYSDRWRWVEHKRGERRTGHLKVQCDHLTARGPVENRFKVERIPGLGREIGIDPREMPLIVSTRGELQPRSDQRRDRLTESSRRYRHRIQPLWRNSGRSSLWTTWSSLDRQLVTSSLCSIDLLTA